MHFLNRISNAVMTSTRPDEWKPEGVASMEPAASDVVRSTQNTLVMAGPGAGKTELLAQKAHYLLTTGQLEAPSRILAISFKRDAATSIKQRVDERCGPLSRRFHSSTLDAFAKGLVDRFLYALPEEWRPRREYQVALRPMPVEQFREWIDTAEIPAGAQITPPQSWGNQKARTVHDLIAHGEMLPYIEPGLDPVVAHLGRAWWRQVLDQCEDRPALSFPMLNRLAAFLLRENPRILDALRHTYSHVFLDEFQDTTGPQYDLITTGFRRSESVVTAVGDDKQRIMLWAGAMPDIFSRYTEDFAATRYDLFLNHRSSPALVAMLRVIAEAVEHGTPLAEATRPDDAGGCIVLEYESHHAEAADIAQIIADAIENENLGPRDFCVLVKQQAANIIGPLQEELASKGIRLRDETELQDLLVEPVIELILDLLELATRDRAPEAWIDLVDKLGYLSGISQDDDIDILDREAAGLVQASRTLTQGTAPEDLPSELLSLIGPNRVRATFRQYSQGPFLVDCIQRLGKALSAKNGAPHEIRAAVDNVIGTDIIPAMTIHKSKSLEFHTVIFLGLEDSQWWSFKQEPDEGKRAFFVAFSRAIHRVYFTYCDEREEKWGLRSQSRADINDLYAILEDADVTFEDRRSSD